MTTVTTKATLKYLRMSPRKVRLLIDLIRGMNVRDARAQLLFSKKAAARPLVKLLESAIANALHNHSAKEESLLIREAFVDGGPIMYRWMPRAMGRATPLRKRTSHITIVLAGEGEEKKKESKKESKESTEQAHVQEADIKNAEGANQMEKKKETKKSSSKKSMRKSQTKK